MTAALWLIEAGARELLMFASIGLLIGGLDDLAVDLIFFARRGWRRATVYRRYARGSVATLPPPRRPGRIAVFIGAWDEAGVIGAMLDNALSRWAGADVRLYVGVYPNDYATLWELHQRFAGNDRVRIVHGDRGIM